MSIANLRKVQQALLPGMALVATMAGASPATDKVLANVQLPPGFHMEVYADNVPNARSMTLGAKGTLFVGSRTANVVHAISPAGSGGKPQVRVIARGLKSPNGVAFHNGALYVAEINRVFRLDGIEDRLDTPPAITPIATLPDKEHHGWRYMAFGPDNKLYVAIGAPCNVCNEPDFATIIRMNADGTGRETFAKGIRNSVGFTWHPQTRELWFTDNGRDMLGDDVPPDELNRAAKAGQDFGFPYCFGGDIKDPEFGNLGACAASTAPVQKLGAHVAALGLKFYTGAAFPAAYRGQIFIPEHGSWNRTQKSGYRLAVVTLQGDRAVNYQPFATGFHRGNEVFGRPVDLLVMADGSLLVSDDLAGAVYRISYHAN